MFNNDKGIFKNGVFQDRTHEFLDKVMDVSQIGFWELDLKTNEYQYSPELPTILGYAPDEIPQTLDAWLSLVHDEDRKRVDPIIKEHKQNNTPYEYEIRMKCKDGAYKWIEVSGKFYKKDDGGDNRLLFGIHRDITVRMQRKEEMLRKLNTVLEPDIDPGVLELSDVLDVETVQKLMDKSYALNQIGMAIVDLKGNILVKTGWQNICTKFHRVHPQTLENCHESDKFLSKNDTPGHFKLYKCKNNLWDISTPIYIGDRKMGYLFFGQFFFDDEILDEAFFRKQAHQYEFDEELYISALKKVPRFSRDKVEKAMQYYIEMLNLITSLSFSRIKHAKTMEELKAKEAQFRAIVETAEDSIFIKDKDLKYIQVNPSMEKTLNIKAEDIINRTASAVFDEETCEKILESDKRVLEGETVEAFYNIPAKGILHIFYSIKVPLRDETGNIKGLCGITRDITELKQAETALRDAKNKAEAASKSKSEFLATMSHELRTPLNGVIGFSEILKGTGLDENQREFIDIVIRSGKNLLAIISDILDFSRIEAKRLKLVAERTDIRELLKNTLEIVQYKAAEKGLKLVKEIEKTLPKEVIIDSLRFQQVLLNLLTNAIKFTNEGQVKLTVSNETMDKEAKKITMHVSVSDTGIGIKEKNQKKIFEAFSQEDMSITRKYGGTGLGLAISKQLLEKMGSNLQMTSTEGKGSDFYFEVVLDYYEHEESRELIETNSSVSKTQIASSIFTDKKVLIAEDDPINMKLVLIALSRYSKELILYTASNGQEAYEQYLQHKPDLIFMDIVMPEVDGYQATNMIREQDAQIPIIAMTAKALKEDKEACLAAGMDDYITKPISLDQMKDALEKYLANPK